MWRPPTTASDNACRILDAEGTVQQGRIALCLPCARGVIHNILTMFNSRTGNDVTLPCLPRGKVAPAGPDEGEFVAAARNG